MNYFQCHVITHYHITIIHVIKLAGKITKQGWQHPLGAKHKNCIWEYWQGDWEHLKYINLKKITKSFIFHFVAWTTDGQIKLYTWCLLVLKTLKKTFNLNSNSENHVLDWLTGGRTDKVIYRVASILKLYISDKGTQSCLVFVVSWSINVLIFLSVVVIVVSLFSCTISRQNP